MSYGITLNDAQELLKRKLLINKMSAECIKYQLEYSKNSAMLQVLTMKTAEDKLKLIEELNIITEKQLGEFTQERQDECKEIYIQINVLDTQTPRFRELVARLDTAQEKMCALMPKIAHLEAQMPPSQLVTNFHIKPKEEPSTAHNCATEALGFGATPPDGF